ncbi:hypothetical protein [Nocardiopsis sp. FIRDI 009]|uniref:hypothetical protein n=1 Tax=Nocardiopsis sp. FIRDI 009 TaxID=714197 RepID=UPI000E268AC0|nr:hypothetical protein [Nocardiopsis sp. FIRDI 009]
MRTPTLRRTRAAAEYRLRHAPDEGAHLRWVAFFQALRSYEEAVGDDPSAVGAHLDRVRAAVGDLAEGGAHDPRALAGLTRDTPTREIDETLSRILWGSARTVPQAA